MKSALAFAAVSEAATGSALLIAPSLVGQLLLGEPLAGVAVPVARVVGIALIALGIACWPGWPPLLGMLIYSALITLYFAYLGSVDVGGILLWPAVVLHAILTALLAVTFRKRDAAKFLAVKGRCGASHQGPLLACAVIRRRFPVGASPTRQTLQPEATGAVMEVTKWLKPSDSVSRYTVTARVCRP
jgi:hypothetical protein